MPKTSKPALDKQIGANIKQIRVSNQISQTALGLALGVSFQQVQKYENGTNRLSASKLIEISRVLKVPPSEILPRVVHSGARRQPGADLAASIMTLPPKAQGVVSAVVRGLVAAQRQGVAV